MCDCAYIVMSCASAVMHKYALTAGTKPTRFRPPTQYRQVRYSPTLLFSRLRHKQVAICRGARCSLKLASR